MDFEAYMAHVATDTVGRYDVTPLFAAPGTFAALRRDLVADVPLADCTHVAGIEALGFVIGSAIAADAELGFLPVRKGGKVPLTDDRVLRRAVTDYTAEEKTLEVAPERVPDGARVLVVDDWVETGAQMRAAVALLEAAGADVLAMSVLRAHREGNADLFERGLVSLG